MNGHRRPSLKDVAKLAGTSVATASRVLNNTGYIADETRSRVTQAAGQLHYQPNLQAQGLRRGASRTIGLLIPNLLNTYYTTLADAISQLLTENGYQLLLSSTRDDPEIEQETMRNLVGHGVDGLIWVPTQGAARLLPYLKSQHIPTLCIVRRIEGEALDTIVFEDFAGSKAAAQHLLQLGHTRIGFIGGDVYHSSNYDRLQGYLEAMHAAGLEASEALVKSGPVRSTWGSLATNELLSLTPPPTAILVASNAIMSGVMKTLRQHHVLIPEQVSVICFDDLDWFSYSSPPISAVSNSHLRLGEAAIDLLLRRLQEPYDPERPPVSIRIGFELVVRSSTMPPSPESSARPALASS